MKTFAKIALRAAILSVAVFFASSCAGGGSTSGDPCNSDVSFCIYPVYQGSLYIGGVAREGRFRYRFHENKSTREYWVDNDWHLADGTHASTGGSRRRIP